MSSKEEIHILDAGPLIRIHQTLPKQLLGELWDLLEDGLIAGDFISHEIVFKEIVPDTGPTDEIGEMISRHREAFKPITGRQIEIVQTILAKFPELIDANARKNQADPWIIAQAIEANESRGLFELDREYLVVTTESTSSPKKMPAACAAFGVKHQTLYQFIESKGWKFTVKAD